MSQSPTSSKHDQTELEKLIRSTKPWFEENGTVLIYALAAVLAIAAVFIYMGRTPAKQVEASRDLLFAVSPEEYRDVADAYPDTVIGIWSRLRQADRLLDDAVTKMFTDRKEGKNLLEQAEAAYKRLADRADISDQVRERVLIGIARVSEVRCDGTDESAKAAIAAWQRVLNEYEDSIAKEHVESRIARLATADCKAFYAWFHAQNPTPEDPGLLPGQPNVPDIPGLDIPGLNIPEATTPADPSAITPTTESKEASDGSEKAPVSSDATSEKVSEPESATKSAEETPVPETPAPKTETPSPKTDPPAEATTAEPTESTPAKTDGKESPTEPTSEEPTAAAGSDAGGSKK